MASDFILIMRLIVPVLERLGIVYWVGGSLASAVHGEFRATNDIDFVIDLKLEHIGELVKSLQNEFYIDEKSVRDAIEFHSSFNAIHLATAYKADFFVITPAPWTQQKVLRRRQELIGEGEDSIIAYVASAKDMIIQKTRRFRMGGGVSDRQWRDVQGMLKVQANSLDFAHLRFWAGQLALTELLNQALEAAGLAGKFALPKSRENGIAPDDAGDL